MTATINNQSYITQARKLTSQFWSAYIALIGMQAQWNALDYGSTLMDGDDSGNVLAGSANEEVTAAEVGAVIFDSMNAIKTTLDSGVATNLAKLL